MKQIWTISPRQMVFQQLSSRGEKKIMAFQNWSKPLRKHFFRKLIWKQAVVVLSYYTVIVFSMGWFIYFLFIEFCFSANLQHESVQSMCNPGKVASKLETKEGWKRSVVSRGAGWTEWTGNTDSTGPCRGRKGYEGGLRKVRVLLISNVQVKNGR